LGKGKLPKAAIADLIECAEFESKYTKQPPADIFKHYIKLMDKYRDYFFDSAWPKDYNFEYATTFTQTDFDFIDVEDQSEFSDRLETMCIKKNLFLNGFSTFGKVLWTQQALQKELEQRISGNDSQEA
jgi:hypothetical protein